MSSTIKTRILFSALWLFWHICATGFFGWNWTVQSIHEIYVDAIFIFMIWDTWTKEI